jgi:putative membrane protein
MKGLVYRWVINALALFFTALIVPGMAIQGFGAALVAALVMGIVNAFVRPLIFLLSLPLTIITLGLFTLVINGFMLSIVAYSVGGFYIRNFWTAFFGAIILSIFSSIINSMIRDK